MPHDEDTLREKLIQKISSSVNSKGITKLDDLIGKAVTNVNPGPSPQLLLCRFEFDIDEPGPKPMSGHYCLVVRD